MNTYTLPTSSPEAQGIDPRAIKALVEAWEASGIRPFALRIIRHGHQVASSTWGPYQPDDNVLKYSLSKTFTASAVGMAVADGLLEIDAPVVSYFPEITGVGPVAQRITLRNVLSMASGHTEDTIEKLDPADPVGSFLRIEPDQEPGSVFCYNQGCTLTQSALVQRVTGQPLHDYLRPRLFDPLGVGPIEWLTLGEYDQGFSGLHITADAVARLGLTILERRRVRRHAPAAPGVDRRGHDRPGRQPRRQRRTGRRGTGSRCGAAATAGAATVRTGSSAWCCATSTSSWPRARRSTTCSSSSTRSGTTCCRACTSEALPETEDLTAFLAARELPTIASTHEGTPGRTSWPRPAARPRW